MIHFDPALFKEGLQVIFLVFLTMYLLFYIILVVSLFRGTTNTKEMLSTLTFCLYGLNSFLVSDGWHPPIAYADDGSSVESTARVGPNLNQNPAPSGSVGSASSSFGYATSVAGSEAPAAPSSSSSVPMQAVAVQPAGELINRVFAEELWGRETLKQIYELEEELKREMHTLYLRNNYIKYDLMAALNPPSRCFIYDQQVAMFINGGTHLSSTELSGQARLEELAALKNDLLTNKHRPVLVDRFRTFFISPRAV